VARAESVLAACGASGKITLLTSFAFVDNVGVAGALGTTSGSKAQECSERRAVRFSGVNGVMSSVEEKIRMAPRIFPMTNFASNDVIVIT